MEEEEVLSSADVSLEKLPPLPSDEERSKEEERGAAGGITRTRRLSSTRSSSHTSPYSVTDVGKELTAAADVMPADNKKKKMGKKKRKEVD